LFSNDFRKYLNNIDTDKLSFEHLQEFLTFLAVKKKIAPATQ